MHLIALMLLYQYPLHNVRCLTKNEEHLISFVWSTFMTVSIEGRVVIEMSREVLF